MDLNNAKHVFVVHSGITTLVAKLVIEQLKIKPENAFIFCRKNSYANALKVVPQKNIILADELFKFYNDGASDVIDRNLLSNVLMSRLVFQTLESAFNRDKAQKVLPALSIDNQEEKAIQGTPFIAYVPHLADLMCNLLVKQPNCLKINYLEEGTLNYINYDALNTEKNYYFEQMLEQAPELSSDKSGVLFFGEYRFYNIGEFENVHLHLKQAESNFYTLTNYSFFYHMIGDKRVLLDVNLLKTQDSLQQSRLYTIKQQALAKHKQLQKHQDGLNQYINVVVFEGQGNVIDNSKFEDYSITLIQNLIDAGIKYAQYKFHPLSTEEVRQSLRDKLVKLEIVLDELDDNISLEEEALIAPEKTMLFHSIQSSALLYTGAFGQYAKCYQEIAANDKVLEKQIEKFAFDMKTLVQKTSKYILE
ncbi:hypothetical protein CKF54_06070 [Psittacicella hinzii]|uniref:Uncharacterized protein n=1 Tax=Psittacicella hinzii TaxID=2028575 RepID=A0A3A1Y2M3_9GAMM|nr:polysialyltransferase family glycosyltransferase [Psittacicella hinzii]RIY31805.1 hypothetical protein CKF54_06070 [Psittacicella hinzii]